MAAISLSARDIEERLEAIQRRLKMRARVHALAYASAITLTSLAFVVHAGGGPTLTREPLWSAVLALAALMGMTAILASLRERHFELARVAEWVDREAALNLRLTTLLSAQALPQRSPLFSVLLLQLVRVLPRYEPRKLVPWNATRPLLAVGAGCLLLAWAWWLSPGLAPGTEPRGPALARTHTSEIPRGVQTGNPGAGAEQHGEAGESGELAAASEGTNATGSDFGAPFGQRGAAGTGDRFGRADGDAAGSEGAEARLGSRARPEGNKSSGDSAGAMESPGKNAPAGGVARDTRGPSGGPEQYRERQGKSAVSSAGQIEPRPDAVASNWRPRSAQAGQEQSPGNERRDFDSPFPRREPRPDGPPQPRLGQSGAAGNGSDGATLYGGAGSDAATSVHRSGAPLVVQLPVASMVRPGTEIQGRGGQSLSLESAPAAGEAAGASSPPLVEKPGLPPEYQALARRLYTRPTQR
ncbi:MAG: hypothetical protein KatS3mg077_2581 [Candidatus Binatia bacterium]|nr:MAG: hypothetical protein KatS3mg077_2581 [Candidatus Binatia bacterium]